MKFFLEILPLIFFFIGYKSDGIIVATIYMVTASIISFIVSYFMKYKISKVNIISLAILIIASSITVFSGSGMFIKMKPTILYIVFSVLLFISNKSQYNGIKIILGEAISLKDQKKWQILNLRFMCFFLFMALLNEIVWRNTSEENWVNFKVFYSLPITMIFFIFQMPFIMKNRIEK